MVIRRSTMLPAMLGSGAILRMAVRPVRSIARRSIRSAPRVDLWIRIPRHPSSRPSVSTTRSILRTTRSIQRTTRSPIHRTTRLPIHRPSSRGVAMLVNRFRGAVEARWVAERNSQCPSARSVGHAVVVRADTPDSLECRTQGERTPVADLASDRADRFPRISKRIRRQCKPPLGQIGHRRHSHHIAEPPRECRPRDAGLGGQSRHCPGVRWVSLHQFQCCLHHRIMARPSFPGDSDPS